VGVSARTLRDAATGREEHGGGDDETNLPSIARCHFALRKLRFGTRQGHGPILSCA
jgi:hypothetical protein